MSQLPPADFSQFKLRINIRTSIENAYRAWSTPSGMSSWFLGKTEFLNSENNPRKDEESAQPGDQYIFHFGCEENSPTEKGSVLKANGKDLFCFTFANACPVTISIYQEHDDTIVELIESNIPKDEDHLRKRFIGDSRGWIFYLTNLKSTLEGGIDLRNKNRAITRVING